MRIKKLSTYVGIFAVGFSAGLLLLNQDATHEQSLTANSSKALQLSNIRAVNNNIESFTQKTSIDEANFKRPSAPNITEQAATENDFYDPSAIATYADDFGIDPAEAERRLARQDDLADRLSEIVALEGNNIAGWGITHEPAFAGWVSLVGDKISHQETQTILDANNDINIKFGANYSITQLEEAQDRLLGINGQDNSHILPHDLNQSLAYVDIDMETNKLVVAIDKNAEAITSGQYTEQDLLLYSQNYLASNLNVNVQVIADTSLTDQATIGGGSSLGGCTAGFSVKDSRGLKGIITAAHCEDHLPGLNFKKSTYSGYSDAQWHSARSGTRIKNNFKADHNKYITPKGFSKRNHMPGKWLCHYGITSGKSCGIVKSNNQSIVASFNNKKVSMKVVLVQGKSLKCLPGDSGGPWYSGRIAYGIHKGSVGPSKGQERCVFSSIDEATRTLGVSILRGK